MKKPLLIFAVLAMQGVSENVFAEEWGPLTNDVQASVKMWAGHSKITTNEPILLQFQIRNTLTNETFYFYWRATYEDSFKYTVISPSGKKLPLIDHIIAGSGGPTPIRPDETDEFNLQLNRLYKFEEPGTYKITVIAMMASQTTLRSHSRVLFDHDATFEVISNPLLVTIAPSK